MRPQEHKKIYELEEDYWWFKAKRHLLVKTVKHLTKDLNCNIRLLDGGCGTGASLLEFQKILPSVGVEKYFDALEFCKQRNLKNILGAELESLPFKKETFDIILALDILEHVDNDIEVLRELSRVGKEKAILIVHVPAFMFLWSDHDLAVEHKRRYTANRIFEQLNNSNFKIRSLSYRLCSFFILGIIKKYFLKLKRLMYKDSKIKAYRPKPPKFINDILYYIIKIEDYLLNFIRLPFGLSIICIAQKDRMEN